HWMASSSSLVNSVKHLGLPICVTGLWVPSAKATVWATFGAWTYFKNSSASGERSGLLTVEVISIHATPPLPAIGPFSGPHRGHQSVQGAFRGRDEHVQGHRD